MSGRAVDVQHGPKFNSVCSTVIGATWVKSKKAWTNVNSMDAHQKWIHLN